MQPDHTHSNKKIIWNFRTASSAQDIAAFWQKYFLIGNGPHIATNLVVVVGVMLFKTKPKALSFQIGSV